MISAAADVGVDEDDKGHRQAKDAASEDSMAWPDLNVLGSCPAPDMCAQGSLVHGP